MLGILEPHKDTHACRILLISMTFNPDNCTVHGISIQQLHIASQYPYTACVSTQNQIKCNADYSGLQITQTCLLYQDSELFCHSCNQEHANNDCRKQNEHIYPLTRVYQNACFYTILKKVGNGFGSQFGMLFGQNSQ